MKKGSVIMKELSKRTKTFTDSVIRRMTRIANEYDAINLSQGFPDFDPPQEILNRLSEVAHEDFNQYAITWGAQNFRDALAKKQSKYMNLDLDSNKNIVVTCGSTEAMMAAMMSVCDPNDKVIVFSPFYENYGADSILCGADPIYVPLHPPVFNFDKEELEYIASLAVKYDTYVITDEVYEHIVYAPYKHTYFASLPGMFERTISCSSLSKTYSITGWRLGYCIAPENIIEQIKKVHDFLTVGAAAPLQEAAVVGLEFSDAYYDELQKLYTHKKDLFINGLKELNIPHTEPQGAYYVMVDISEFGYDSDLDFCVDLIKNVGVAAVPGSSFFKEKENRYIRFHFAKKDETLLSALNRLKDMRAKMPYKKTVG